jgi:hypothetical protein
MEKNAVVQLPEEEKNKDCHLSLRCGIDAMISVRMIDPVPW